MNWGIRLACLALALTACAPEVPPRPTPEPIAPVEPTATPAVAECPPSGVRIEATASDAAMGLRVQAIEMVNCGDQPYTVNGYPAIRVLDEERKPLPVEFLKGSSQISTVESFERPPREVTLQPGERATSGIVWKNRHTDLNAPMLGKFLEFSPLEGRPWQPELVPNHVDLGSTDKIGVAPWEKKSSS